MRRWTRSSASLHLPCTWLLQCLLPARFIRHLAGLFHYRQLSLRWLAFQANGCFCAAAYRFGRAIEQLRHETPGQRSFRAVEHLEQRNGSNKDGERRLDQFQAGSQRYSSIIANRARPIDLNRPDAAHQSPVLFSLLSLLLLIFLVLILFCHAMFCLSKCIEMCSTHWSVMVNTSTH